MAIALNLNGVEKNVAKYMKDRAIKQAPIAKKMGMSPDAFSLILRGKRAMKATEFQNFCRAVKVDPNDIFDYEKLEELDN